MKSFRGQAALEFMMTYGWAILVVLAAIGALSYFGILNPSKFTPDTCLASSGFACPGKPIVNDTAVTFSIVNGLGYKVNLNTTSNYLSLTPTNLWSACSNRYVCAQGNITCTNTAFDVEDGAGATVRIIGCNFAGVQVVKGEARFTYRNVNSKLDEMAIVSITGKSKS